MRDAEIQEITDHIFYLLHAGIAKLHHFAAIGADDVVVLFVAIRLFKLGEVFPELVLFHQITIDEQLQRIVHRSPADAVAAVFHVDVQSLGIEVVVAFVYFFQNGEALRGFAQTGFFQLRGKNSEYLLDGVLFVTMG